jgi:hypothetical protein
MASPLRALAIDRHEFDERDEPDPIPAPPALHSAAIPADGRHAMPVSQNGYPANDRSSITTYTIGKGCRVALRAGSAGAMLKHLADWFDAHIKDVDPGERDDWGYAERKIRGSSTTLSNHASGTALDVNATQWPLGSDPSVYLSAEQIAAVRRRLKLYQGCIRWGGDYTGRKDPMHFEINRDQATVDRVWKEIQGTDEGDDMPSLDDIEQLFEAKLKESLAQRTRQVLADGTIPYGLDALRRRLDLLEEQQATILKQLDARG